MMKRSDPSPRLKREETIFCEALGYEAASEREVYLRQACGADEALRERVENLLRMEAEAGSFLAGDGVGSAGEALREGPGWVVGRYKLLQKIGEGGFGVVYMAEQREPVKRRVALKIIKLGMDTKQVIGRFEAERQALALMDHPNIAKVLDGGATETGRPYFVMELVRGIPVTQYCDENHVPTVERLRLFMEICSALQHAHQKGVIHRDIKPSNVLVTMHDDRAVPKVIDFGVAKATQHELTEKTIFTRFHEFIGTPAYMSPEQAQMSGLDVDTRSDIYSLGVLLYELLTGRTPFDAVELLSGGYDEIRRRLREDEPLKPSTRLDTLSQEDRAGVAKRHQTDPQRLRHLLRGDLDWIVMKAMEKDRARRYESASALAQDVRRYLDHEPVTAAAPSLLYKLGKFGRRHRTAATMAGLLVLFLVGASFISTYFAVRATKAERHARQEADLAAAVNQFLNEDLFAQADPALAPDTELRVRTLLDRAAQQSQSRFEGRPLIEAAIQATLGQLYYKLSEYEDAERHLNRAFELRFHELGPDHPETIALMSELSMTRLFLGRKEDAWGLAEDVLERARRSLGPRHPSLVRYLSRLAWLAYHTARNEAIYQYAKEAVDLAQTLPEVDPKDYSSALHMLGRMLGRRGQIEAGEGYCLRAIELLSRTLGENHPSTVMSRHNLATYYFNLRYKLPEAETIYLLALDQQRRILGESHDLTLTIRRNLELFYRSQGRWPAALYHLTQQLEFTPPQHADKDLHQFRSVLARTGLPRLDHSAVGSAPTWLMADSPPYYSWMQTNAPLGQWTETASPAASELWVRREFHLESVPPEPPLVVIRNGGEFELFLNGRPIPADRFRKTDEFQVVVGDLQTLASLRPGLNLLAVHGRNLNPEKPLGVELLERPAPPSSADSPP